MNKQPQQEPILTIKAQYIGPIMRLDQELSSRKQNLIFARSGVGKSFIARALRCLDQSAFSDVPEEKIPDLLVSEEAPTGQGSFSLYEGQDCIGHLDLNTKEKSVHRSEPAYIFHVFSEDYVDEQLRNKIEKLARIIHGTA